MHTRIIITFLTFFVWSCKTSPDQPQTIAATTIDQFIKSHPDFSAYGKDLETLYKERQQRYIWFDGEDRNDLADVLYNRARQIEREGIPVALPYRVQYEKLFNDDKATPEHDLLLTAMYLFYVQKTQAGIDPAKSKQLGWFLPRKKVDFADYLDELMADENALDEQPAMYTNLRKGLQRYQEMKSKGIATDAAGVSVDQRIKAIIVNMERCRWLSKSETDIPEYVAVNIPSYRMRYVRDGKTVLESDVIVGDEANKTVVFSGKMSYLVFSPYWNIPQSIVEKEIKPELAKDKDYLEKRNMEWYGKDRLRQKPGADNSLGLVKFMFPNQNNIYLHDTPEKILFNKEDRALSHGCVRVQKARELAVKILDGDKNWTPEKIDQAMHAGKEQEYALDRKIPVYLTYFTAVADESGNVTFYDDVYKRDDKVIQFLY
ncbi:L,D-transpeptidase YcbB [Flavobacterium longum]|uniref:L,D-transpeptidase family protein n=1 Tax=Flavobacterium longum TaxID=1299340 RepID=UPI0039EB0A48